MEITVLFTNTGEHDTVHLAEDETLAGLGTKVRAVFSLPPNGCGTAPAEASSGAPGNESEVALHLEGEELHDDTVLLSSLGIDSTTVLHATAGRRGVAVPIVHAVAIEHHLLFAATGDNILVWDVDTLAPKALLAAEGCGEFTEMCFTDTAQGRYLVGLGARVAVCWDVNTFCVAKVVQSTASICGGGGLIVTASPPFAHPGQKVPAVFVTLWDTTQKATDLSHGPWPRKTHKVTAKVCEVTASLALSADASILYMASRNGCQYHVASVDTQSGKVVAQWSASEGKVSPFPRCGVRVVVIAEKVYVCGVGPGVFVVLCLRAALDGCTVLGLGECVEGDVFLQHVSSCGHVVFSQSQGAGVYSELLCGTFALDLHNRLIEEYTPHPASPSSSSSSVMYVSEADVCVFDHDASLLSVVPRKKVLSEPRAVGEKVKKKEEKCVLC